MLAVEAISLESFSIRASDTGGKLVVTLSGTADMAAYEPLGACITEIRGEVARLNFAEVCIDIRSLYLLNSSCIKVLLRLVYLAQTETPHFNIEFLVDPNLGWQRRALAPFRRVAPGLVQIT